MAVSIMAYVAVVTYILLFIVDHIPGLKLRASEESEIVGIDEAECGELGYDYVSIRREMDDSHGETGAGLSNTVSRSSNEKVGHHQVPESSSDVTREGPGSNVQQV